MADAIEVLTVEDEIEIVRGERGSITPLSLVEWAEDHPDSALYRRFDWDDGLAAAKWRLAQARNILHVYVKMDIPEHLEPVTVRAYVSLPADRLDGSGYRPILEVFRDEDRKGQLLKMAKGELRSFRYKYKTITELAEVFTAIDRVL